jgi:signal transduction histidine kinase/CheY-like chemotaxis protein
MLWAEQLRVMPRVKRDDLDIIESTVLVVDDEPFFRRMIRDTLEREAYHVIEASSGKDVETLITRHCVSAVVTDIEMPEMSGQIVLTMVKRLQPGLPVIIISSHQDFNAARQVLRDGALDYLVKPFSDEELCQAVKRAVSLYEKGVEERLHREESERRLADLVLLREVGETASGEVDIQSLLERILDFACEAVKVETASLMLAEDAGFLTIRASRGLPEKVVSGSRVAIGDSVAGHVFQTGDPVLLLDMDEDDRFLPSGDAGQYSTRSALSLPLKVRDRVIGVLNVNNKCDGETFTATDQYFLASVAHQATMALENLNLVNRLKDEASRLAALNRVRTRLVCTLSHELRTPLTTVLGFADLVLNHREMVGEVDLLDYLGKIQDGGLQMERLISEMMMLFRLDSGTAIWQLERFDFKSLCEEVLSGFSEQIAKAGLSFNLWVSDIIPRLLNDTEKLRAVLEALIDNAIKFNQSDGLISISARLHPEDESKITIRVYNSGKKIPKGAVEEIFAPYSQLGELNTDKPKGVGIGLTLCKAVVEIMHGEIRLDQSNDDGTTFSLVLPMQCNHLQKGEEL